MSYIYNNIYYIFIIIYIVDVTKLLDIFVCQGGHLPMVGCINGSVMEVETVTVMSYTNVTAITQPQCRVLADSLKRRIHGKRHFMIGCLYF